MGRGKGSPVMAPPPYCPLAPQSLDKQTLASHFFALKAPLVDPYPPPPDPSLQKNALLALRDQLVEEPCDDYEGCYFDEERCYDDSWSDDDYDDRWDELEEAAQRGMRPQRPTHVSRARLQVDRSAGRQRHLHVSVHQVRRAELKEAQRSAALELRRARIEAPLTHCSTAPTAIAPCAPHVSYARRASGASTARRSAWGSGPSVGSSTGGWEAAPTAAVMRTATGRRVQLSREEQDVAAAIQASLAADSNVAGGLTMEQIAELLTRDLSPNDYEMLLRLDESVQKKTLSAETVARLCPTRPSTKEDLAGGKCTICQCEYEEAETLQTTPCAHTFHADCLLQWLTKSSTKCALCNKALE